MLKKIILISILLPIFVILVLVSTHILFSDSKNIVEYQSASIVITYAIVLSASYKMNILKVDEIRINFKEFNISLIASFVLFCIFYAEKVMFNDYNKKTPTFILSFITVVLTPIVEESFNKKIILDNLRVLKFNTFWTIIIPSLFFTIFHYPNILLIHFLMGLVSSYIYYKNRNILQVIFIHIIYNFLIILFNYI